MQRFTKISLFSIICLCSLLVNTVWADNASNKLAELLTPATHAAKTVLDNPNGDITVIEFTDYNCHYCRQLAPEVDKLIQKDPNVRLVVIDFPVITTASVDAAQAALAARQQGQYLPYHTALMSSTTQLDNAAYIAIAEKLKLNMPEFKKDLKNPELIKEINNNLSLGDALDISGTPTIIIAKTQKRVEDSAKMPQPVINFGYVSFDDLEQGVKDYRAKQ